MKLKRLVPTSYGVALAILSTVLPLPVWVAFTGFGYFTPAFVAQVLACWPVLFSLFRIVMPLMNNNPVATGFVYVLTMLVLAGIYWLAARLCNRWLLSHYPWFRSVR